MAGGVWLVTDGCSPRSPAWLERHLPRPRGAPANQPSNRGGANALWKIVHTHSENTLQKLPPALVVGTRVRVRGTAWCVQHVHPYEGCTVVRLTGTNRDNSGQSSTLIFPFDRFEPEQRPARLRVVRKRRWCHAFRELLTLDHPFDGLRAAARARIQLLPFQLEPALAVIRGLACRLLLADEVGLGKTIQAGLILAELRERGLADRVLLLTPAGLRRQWQEELDIRFAIPSTIVDSTLLRRRSSLLPAGTNPWLLDEVAIVSIDLVKRSEALRSMASIMWDVLLIDEAHLVAHAPQRQSALRRLGSKARRVILISATPHSGDSDAFTALCRLGEGDGHPLAMFRRTRSQVGLTAKRRVRMLWINLSTDELRLHQLLGTYAQLVYRDEVLDRHTTGRGGLLAMTVLTKRALSSPASLRISIQRRIQLLSRGDDLATDAQLLLPFTDDEHDDRDVEPTAVLAAPGLTDRLRELTLLREIETASSAVPVGRKVRVLGRFLQRVKEPVIVFTEYRDTLQHVAREIAAVGGISVIHGGLDETERVRARKAFVEGATRVLLTTDAGGEGLNLHDRCRLVINLELPWNPTRLEQRIGRVDRLGQTRQVHAINLFARGTSEEHVLTRLVHRLGRARSAVGQVNDPLGTAPDLTEVMLENNTPAPHLEAAEVVQPALGDAARTEVSRLNGVRRLGLYATKTDLETVPVASFRRPQLRGLLGSSSMTCLLLARLVSGDGELVEHVLVPLTASCGSIMPVDRVVRRPHALRGMVQDVLDALGSDLHARALAVVQRRLRTIGTDYQVAMEMRRARERSLIQMIEMNTQFAAFVQPDLFSTRILQGRATALRSHATLLAAESACVTLLERASELSVADVKLALVLVVA